MKETLRRVRRLLFPTRATTNIVAVVAFASLLLIAPARGADEKSDEDQARPIVAVFRLQGPLSEAPVDESFSMFSQLSTSLKDLVGRMDKAAGDSRVKAVVIVPDDAEIGMAQIEELRAAMARIRSHGKGVFVHADEMLMGGYVMAAGASRISVVPTGNIIISGLNASSMHVRGLLDKLGVKPDFITEGAYKSAAELFMREQPSPQADEMMNWLLDSWYGSFKDLIAQGRKVDPAKAQQWLDAGLFTAVQAKDAGLIDAVEQRQDFENMLKSRFGRNVVFDKKYGRKTQVDMDMSSPLGLFKLWGELLRGPEKSTSTRHAIGVIYVNGPIMTGKSTSSPFGAVSGAFSSDVRDALEKATLDDSIDAVVLRVDSPGGSVTASEIILDATRRLKAEKPLVVSMGDVAGSGGYYVACAADTIFADATTLTGSIGVLGGKLATTEMWKKVGVTFKEYKRGENAGMFSSDDVFTDSERARMKSTMDEAYALFKTHVTDIRGKRLKKPIEELAGGRVYTGKQALDLGLVDKLGTLQDAIAYAAEQAKTKDYDVRVVPEPKNFLEQLMEQFSGGKDEPEHVQMAQNSFFKLAMPYLQNLDPRRMSAVLSALTRLQILQKEGAVLSMPEILPVQ